MTLSHVDEALVSGARLWAICDQIKLTFNEWFDRYYAWRKGRPRGAEPLDDSKGRFKKWISPRLGTLSMASVTRDALEDFVSFLDDQAGDEVIAPKMAQNIWGEVAAAFNAATHCKDQGLRVLETNRADHSPYQSIAAPAAIIATPNQSVDIGRCATHAATATTTTTGATPRARAVGAPARRRRERAAQLMRDQSSPYSFLNAFFSRSMACFRSFLSVAPGRKPLRPKT